ncbi:MAG: hypothetical protein JSR98_15630 [Proteobacteria bacterium]|nr:hypothetical protein [Pseudomonadota bacterium]
MSVADAMVWTSEFRSPRNSAAEVKGSIHDDATASRLGFRGGTVAGSIHMDQFVPGLLKLYGDGWFETGGLSLYFTKATTDSEPVKATVEAGADRARLTMHDVPGDQICEGTASLGPDARSELAKRLEAQAPATPGALRILKDLAVGEEHRDIPVRIEADQLLKSLETLTEPLPAYRDDLILPPSHLVRLTHQDVRRHVVGKAGSSVGLFGALETQHLAGPLKAGVDYVARTRMLKLTESPKTENAWYEVLVADGAGRDVARVVYYLRFMKASSPLWA